LLPSFGSCRDFNVLTCLACLMHCIVLCIVKVECATEIRERCDEVTSCKLQPSRLFKTNSARHIGFVMFSSALRHALRSIRWLRSIALVFDYSSAVVLLILSFAVLHTYTDFLNTYITHTHIHTPNVSCRQSSLVPI